jgi:hypothetical protein
MAWWTHRDGRGEVANRLLHVVLATAGGSSVQPRAHLWAHRHAGQGQRDDTTGGVVRERLLMRRRRPTKLSQLAALNTPQSSQLSRGDQRGWLDQKASGTMLCTDRWGHATPCACTGPRPRRPPGLSVCCSHTHTRPSESRCGVRRTRIQRIGIAAQSPTCPAYSPSRHFPSLLLTIAAPRTLSSRVRVTSDRMDAQTCKRTCCSPASALDTLSRTARACCPPSEVRYARRIQRSHSTQPRHDISHLRVSVYQCRYPAVPPPGIRNAPSLSMLFVSCC